jgi:hypothetical protein
MSAEIRVLLLSVGSPPSLQFTPLNPLFFLPSLFLYEAKQKRKREKKAEKKVNVKKAT